MRRARRWMAFVAVLAALMGLGAWAVAGDTRDVKVGRTEANSLLELGMRRQGLTQERQGWEARWAKLEDDTAAIHSEIRSRYAIGEREQFVKIDPATCLLTVGAAPAPPPGTGVAGTR